MNTVLPQGAGSGGGGGGGGGSGSSGGGFGGGYYYGSGGGSCTGEECKRNGIIVGSVVGGIFGLFCIAAIIVCFRKKIRSCFKKIFCCVSAENRPPKSNTTFIELNSVRSEKMSTFCKFISGQYAMRYYQYSSWHGPYDVQLEFDDGTVIGHGTDNIGSFTVKGVYSEATGRLGLTKKYQLGTGDRLENLGHEVTIQLEWNSDTENLNGKWYVRTKNYSGQDKFELKFKSEGEKV